MVVMEHDPNAKCLRSRPALYVNLEDCVFLWMSQVQSKGAIISDDILLEKAKELWEKIAVSDDYIVGDGLFALRRDLVLNRNIFMERLVQLPIMTLRRPRKRSRRS